jgi:hypothetical protein
LSPLATTAKKRACASMVNINQIHNQSEQIKKKASFKCGQVSFFRARLLLEAIALRKLLVLVMLVNHLVMTNQAHDIVYTGCFQCSGNTSKKKKKTLEKGVSKMTVICKGIAPQS